MFIYKQTANIKNKYLFNINLYNYKISKQISVQQDIPDSQTPPPTPSEVLAQKDETVKISSDSQIGEYKLTRFLPYSLILISTLKNIAKLTLLFNFG